MTQLDFSLGLAQESVYGTPVTPTRFPESDAQIKYEISTVDGRGLRPSKGVKRLARNTVSKFEGKGSISLDVGTRGFGMLLNAVMGGITNTAIPSSSPVLYQQVHTLSQSDAVTKSFTVQELLPTIGGDDVWPHTFTGVVFESMEISAKEGGILEAVFEVVARALSTIEPGATPSYPTGDSVFTFLHGVVKISTNPMTTAPTATGLGLVPAANNANVKEITVRVKRNLDGGGWNMGGAGLRSRRPVNGRPEISGSFTVEYSNNTLRDAYLAQTPLALHLTFTHSDVISTGGSGQNALLQIIIPSLRLKGEVPGSNGGEPITQSIDWEAFDNDVAAQPIYIVYRTLDTTL